jgi:hypothetical protein
LDLLSHPPKTGFKACRSPSAPTRERDSPLTWSLPVAAGAARDECGGWAIFGKHGRIEVYELQLAFGRSLKRGAYAFTATDTTSSGRSAPSSPCGVTAPQPTAIVGSGGVVTAGSGPDTFV